MKTFETFLPLFTGFYNTLFEPDLDSYFDSEDIDDNKERDYIYGRFDNTKYETDMSLFMCDAIQNAIDTHLGLECEITLQEVIKPSYYNYRNDSVNIEIKIDIKKLLDLVNKNYEVISENVKNDYKSYDGFIPSYKNNLDIWIKEINENENLDHYIGALLGYLLNIKEYDRYSLYHDVADDIYICDYINEAED